MADTARPKKLPIGTAAEFARTTPEWTMLSWFQLEARVLKDYPKVHGAVVRFAPKEVWRDFRPERIGITGPLWAISEIASLVLPVIAAVLALRTLLPDGDHLDLARVGLLMGIAAVLASIGIIGRWRSPEESHPRTMRKIGLIHLGSAIIAGAIGIGAVIASSPQNLWGFVGIAADLGVGLYFVLTSRIPKNESADILRNAGILLEKRTDALTARERAAIIADVRGAVAILSERGLIDAADAAKAHDAPAGYLSLRMIARDADPAVA